MVESVVASRVSASTQSKTLVKQRVWLPSPWIVTGSPLIAWRTKRGTAMPDEPLWRGPVGRTHQAVRAALAGPGRVEQAGDGDGVAPLAMEGERDELVGRLGQGVGPADLLRRPEDRVVVLPQAVGIVLAVALAGRREHRPDAALRAELEHLLAGPDV